jgi:hypothetical protein
LPKKKSKGKKTENKASAEPIVDKIDTAVTESVIEPSASTTKGVKPEEITEIINTDLAKVDYDELNATFDIDESDNVDLTGKAKEKAKPKVKKKKVIALIESKVLEVLSTVFEKNKGLLMKQGYTERNANKIAGSTISEFMNYLDLIIPDEFSPKNAMGKKMKKENSADWKLNAINVEHANSRMKELMAMGKIRIITVKGKSHFVPISSILKNSEAYIGSLWHIKQIRNILYNSKQWKSASQPYSRFFKDSNPLNLTFNEFENVLSTDEKALEFMWTKTGFDHSQLKGLGKTTT